MDHPEQSTTDGSSPPRRRLQVARETLRQLGARTLRQVAGGTMYTQEPTECTPDSCWCGAPSEQSCGCTDSLDCPTGTDISSACSNYSYCNCSEACG